MQKRVKTLTIARRLIRCEFVIGCDLLNEIAQDICGQKEKSQIVIVADGNIPQISEALRLSLQKNGFDANIIICPPGEINKTRRTKEGIEDEMFRLVCDRKTLLIAVGGGVVGDIASFVASTYMRGIAYCHIPTTLLAQADSCIGGKTGVNSQYGKNLIGTFYYPRKIFIDTAFLKSLDDENFKNGLVEILKHGAIMDEVFFNYVDTKLNTLNARAPSIYDGLLLEILTKNAAIKMEVVAKDPFETGLRKILNFGHTVGHALELLSNYTLSHGRAVALGMMVETFIGYELGITCERAFMQIKNVVKKLGFSTNYLDNISGQTLYDVMQLDKKASDKFIEFVLLEKIGSVKCSEKQHTVRIDKRSIISSLNKFMSVY